MSGHEPPAEALANWALLHTQIIWAYEGVPPGAGGTQGYSGRPAPCWLLLEGRVRLEYADAPREQFGAGTWIIGRDLAGRQSYSRDARLLSLRFLAEWPHGQPLFDRDQTVSFPADSPEGRLLETPTRELAVFAEKIWPGTRTELLQERGSLETHLELRKLESAWLAAYAAVMQGLGRQPNRLLVEDPRLDRALGALRTRPLAEPMRERELAELAGLSLSQLNRLFAAKLGRTPAEIWENRRLGRARTLLVATGQSVKSIAYELGFSSPPHFTSWFRERTGATPVQYRATRREV
jgi:AraC-like DNA-binding protein